MKALIVFMFSISIACLSCSNPITSSFKTATPEEFGRTLLETCIENDSSTYAKLIITETGLLKYLEESAEYKKSKPNIQLFSRALVESTFEKNNGRLKESFGYVMDDFKREGITDLKNAKVVKVESKDLSKNNIYWINTAFEVNGNQFIIRCSNVYVVPGEGFRIFREYPSVYKVHPSSTR